jgi:hypothetical protein
MSEERKHRPFWAVTVDHRVRQAEGYECAANADAWWVPEVGYTMSYGVHLFDTEVEALNRALSEVQEEQEKLQRAVEGLIARLAEAQRR